MALQIFKAGNSNVVSIPKEFGELGEKVTYKISDSGDSISYKKVKDKTTQKKSPVSSEFKKWLKDVLVEDKEILDELSVR